MLKVFWSMSDYFRTLYIKCLSDFWTIRVLERKDVKNMRIFNLLENYNKMKTKTGGLIFRYNIGWFFFLYYTLLKLNTLSHCWKIKDEN